MWVSNPGFCRHPVEENSPNVGSESGKSPLARVTLCAVIQDYLRDNPTVLVAGLDRINGAACNLRLWGLGGLRQNWGNQSSSFEKQFRLRDRRFETAVK